MTKYYLRQGQEYVSLRGLVAWLMTDPKHATSFYNEDEAQETANHAIELYENLNCLEVVKLTLIP